MSTDWSFEYNSNKIKYYCKKLAELESRPAESGARISDNKNGLFCVGKHPGNGAWIYLGCDGTGVITRYAGTSPENLSIGFDVLTDIICAKNIFSEYELQEEMPTKHLKNVDI